MTDSPFLLRRAWLIGVADIRRLNGHYVEVPTLHGLRKRQEAAANKREFTPGLRLDQSRRGWRYKRYWKRRSAWRLESYRERFDMRGAWS